MIEMYNENQRSQQACREALKKSQAILDAMNYKGKKSLLKQTPFRMHHIFDQKCPIPQKC